MNVVLAVYLVLGAIGLVIQLWLAIRLLQLVGVL